MGASGKAPEPCIVLCIHVSPEGSRRGRPLEMAGGLSHGSLDAKRSRQPSCRFALRRAGLA